MEGRRNPRRGGNEMTTYNRRGRASTSLVDEDNDIEEDHTPIILNDDENVDDDYGQRPRTSTREDATDSDTNEVFDLDDYA
ncbi:hypothetical protein ACET3Z_005455 [Daucus carota]